MVSSGHAIPHRAHEEDRAQCANIANSSSIISSLKRCFPVALSLSSGVVEGLNNKAKATMRKSYGFRTFRCLELALYHSLGKLPEPESTHDFF